MSKISALMLAAAAAPLAAGHVCLVAPEQRGGANITGPAANDCFNKPSTSDAGVYNGCGDKEASTPVQLTGGQGYSVLFQQNLNHWQPGVIGGKAVLEVQYAPDGTSPQEEDFTTLASVEDFWAHQQANQQDFRVHVTIPNPETDVENGVLRVVYAPQKPGEPDSPGFVQCADVTVEPFTPPPGEVGSFYAQVSTFGGARVLKEIQPDGTLSDVFAAPSLLDGLLNTDVDGTVAVSLASDDGAKVTFDGANNTATIEGFAQPESGSWVGSAPGALVAQFKNDDGTYQYAIGDMDTGKILTEKSEAEDEYVNYLWSARDGNTVYTLAGYEDGLYTLNTTVHTFDLNSGDLVSSTELDISEYTFNSFAVDPDSGDLYALSPGLFQSFEGYSLVKVDPSSGAVDKVGEVADADTLQEWYGNGVYGQAIFDGNYMNIVKDAVTGATAFARVLIETGELAELQYLDDGINGGYRIGSVVSVQPSS